MDFEAHDLEGGFTRSRRNGPMRFPRSSGFRRCRERSRRGTRRSGPCRIPKEGTGGNNS